MPPVGTEQAALPPPSSHRREVQADELGKRSATLRFFGRVFLFSPRPRPPHSGRSAIVQQVALTSTASIVVALAAWQAHRPDLIRSPKRVLAHLWEDCQLGNAF